jgi:hypothetical protein
MMASGCGGTGAPEKGASLAVEDTRPVTLKFYPHQPMIASDFKLIIADQVNKKYPYITVELMDRNAMALDQMVAAGEGSTCLASVTAMSAASKTWAFSREARRRTLLRSRSSIPWRPVSLKRNSPI